MLSRLTGGTLLNLGGIFGAVAIGALAARFALRPVLMAYLITTAVMLSAFISSSRTPSCAACPNAATRPTVE
ncbi:hypothetical protein ADK76_24965 [Streptomyces griseoflavus]|uniref:hypothetical protein n=1 Tax=Streptomyces rimosus TaxID=1927 RepID=UPI0004CA9546|nr:hypothetical protein [Streptomyces rimosus]KOG54149.1 hypothetical protein ADK76_24965 [Streptomyces griseoflavus]